MATASAPWTICVPRRGQPAPVRSGGKSRPKLRVLARSSPADKLTLCNGLNKSLLFGDKQKVAKLRKEFNIDIYPDRQVVAMTGDGMATT